MVLVGLEPPTADTVTLAAPEPEGTATLSSEGEITSTAVAVLSPNSTDTDPTKLLPRIVTCVPPFSGPTAGEIPLITGGAAKVNWSVAATGLTVRSSTDIMRLTVPEAVAGRVPVHVVVLEQETVIQFVPTLTSSAPVIGRNPEPVIVTELGCPLGPELGVTLVICGVRFCLPYWRHIWAASPG
jgi:hypothetical protein